MRRGAVLKLLGKPHCSGLTKRCLRFRGMLSSEGLSVDGPKKASDKGGNVRSVGEGVIVKKSCTELDF